MLTSPIPRPSLPQVEQHAPAVGGDRVDRGVELWPAIAFEAAEHVAGQALAVQPHQRRPPGRLADHQRDMLAGLLGRAERDDLRVLRAQHGQPGARGDRQSGSILMRVDRRRRDRHLGRGVLADEEGGQHAGQPGEAQRRGGCDRVWHGDRAKRTLQRRGKIELRVGQSSGGGEVEPRRAFDQYRPVGGGRGDLVDQLQRRRATGRQQHVGAAIGIVRGEAHRVRGLDRQQRQTTDRDRPAAAQRVDRACRIARVASRFAHHANSVMIGTWSDGFSHARHSSNT